MSVTILRYSEPLDTLAVDPRYVRAPKLCDVLMNKSSAPYTRSSFEAYLAQNYCSEVLDFTTDVFSYQKDYKDLIFTLAPPQPSHNSAMIWEQWESIINMYIKPNAPREINVPADTRNHLLSIIPTAGTMPPSPDYLEPAYKLMLELMNGIYLQWTTAVHPESPSVPIRIDCKPCM